MNAFLPADILMPKTDHMEKWAVIACDQFTTDQAYWDRVRTKASLFAENVPQLSGKPRTDRAAERL